MQFTWYYHLHAADNASKHSVFIIKPGRGDQSDEKLRPICVWASVRRTQLKITEVKALMKE